MTSNVRTTSPPHEEQTAPASGEITPRMQMPQNISSDDGDFHPRRVMDWLRLVTTA
jgi:hypothetical protein